MKRPLIDRGDGTFGVVLTRGQVAIVDAVDAEWAGQWNWSATTQDRVTKQFRAVRGVRRAGRSVTLLLHREILSRMLCRDLAPGEECDHRDGDPLHDRRENLRLATDVQNSQNRSRHASNTSGYPGVSWHTQTGKWRANIRLWGARQQHLGLFPTAEAAHAAYEAAAQARGEYKRPIDLY